MADKSREFYVWHEAIMLMSKKHHVLTGDDWHIKQDLSALRNPDQWLRVIEYSAFEALQKENEKFRKEMDKITKGYPSEWAYSILKKERDELDQMHKNDLHTIQEITIELNNALKENKALRSNLVGQKEARELKEKYDQLKFWNVRLQEENEKLKEQVKWNLQNNDEFGCEFLGITIVRDENRLLKEKLELAVETTETLLSETESIIKNPRYSSQIAVAVWETIKEKALKKLKDEI